jgi:hypothetical protein
MIEEAKGTLQRLINNQVYNVNHNVTHIDDLSSITKNFGRK